MPTVKISFNIEVDDELVISHAITQSGISCFDNEREFALEVINRMNCFYTERNINNKSWKDFARIREKMKKRQQERFSGDAQKG
ncbi:hypothetical protein M3703_04165 [Mannheimia haemolytica]|uniref:hypothetical protein n=1 Tax=Mannheimia haemolytica TaxID=75985 RepID=UPI00201C55D2|nr:hypothetical protein [Mannheimia haemolytica]MDW0618454.1 hypothetical protein [Mannheimia haemolytica]UQX68852.1 hypothetical protein M3705_07500 [Mannheimia haemolytica]UQX80519.1 hypothetical protein M3703_04165 [Mannheimia haemolytica]HDL1262043.1 hypothetical protein [Mannheimia haemolytica]